MNEEFQYIASLAQTYHLYSEQPDKLIQALNELPKSELEEIYKEYSELGRYGPVNTLRIEVLHRLIDDQQVSKEAIEEIKSRIRDQDAEAFRHLPKDFQDRLIEPRTGNRDIFSMHQGEWNLFYTFFYREKVKRSIRSAVTNISDQLLEDLELTDYSSHTVDFVGMRRNGDDYCWIGIYPKELAHNDSYQFFLSIGDRPHAGKGVGGNLGDWNESTLVDVNSYDEALTVLKRYRNEIISDNEELIDNLGVDVNDENSEPAPVSGVSSGKGFADQLKEFLKQAKTDNLHTAHFDKRYLGVQVKVSFGMGAVANIPWISFLREGQTTAHGIY
ncbi:MAG: hypothetical protein HKN33_11580, partial [Pyrinomonadaceae bacterium]|nr:hypothetical protein [Pyrinomonadaceae bacterium]